MDFFDDTVDGGEDFVVHLHGLQEEEGVPFFDLFLLFDVDFDDGAGDEGMDALGCGRAVGFALVIFPGEQGHVLNPFVGKGIKMGLVNLSIGIRGCCVLFAVGCWLLVFGCSLDFHKQVIGCKYGF